MEDEELRAYNSQSEIFKTVNSDFESLIKVWEILSHLSNKLRTDDSFAYAKAAKEVRGGGGEKNGRRRISGTGSRKGREVGGGGGGGEGGEGLVCSCLCSWKL
eukprot:268282-Hanusia_phi.AAC.1